MSDYFTSLATRAVQDGGAMRPRPRTRFEPIGVAAASAAPAGEDVTAAAHGQDGQATTGRALGGRRRVGSAERTSAGGQPERTDVSWSVPWASAPGDRDGDGRSDASSDGNGPSDGGPFHDQPRQQEAAAGRRTDVPQTAVQTSRSVITPAASGKAIRVEVHAAARRPDAPPPEAATPRGDASRDDGAEPVVRIHIGRVDVRAATPAPERAAPRPGRGAHDAPLMTLDEYARRRREARS